MTITDLAPEPLHVIHRGNALVATGGHLLDMAPNQVAWLEDEMRRLIESQLPGALPGAHSVDAEWTAHLQGVADRQRPGVMRVEVRHAQTPAPTGLAMTSPVGAATRYKPAVAR